MASTDHTVRLATRTYERLEAEAQRRHRAVDEVADELLGERLPNAAPDLGRVRKALDQLAGLKPSIGTPAGKQAALLKPTDVAAALAVSLTRVYDAAKAARIFAIRIGVQAMLAMGQPISRPALTGPTLAP